MLKINKLTLVHTILQSLEDLSQRFPNTVVLNNKNTDDYPIKPVSMTLSELAPLSSISEVTLSNLDIDKSLINLCDGEMTKL